MKLIHFPRKPLILYRSSLLQKIKEIEEQKNSERQLDKKKSAA
ncbi:hypothetical protein [Holdemania sp. Marseille-P2844]|nr:hypothetical protein [Holdemania sp. Marseille-P2844]